MDSEDTSNMLPAIKEYLQNMDDIRGLNFVETFPELKHLYV